MNNPGRHKDEGESYKKARNRLLEAEKALRDERERVAEMRRSLPPGPVVEDYRLEAEDGAVRLSALFKKPDLPLALYHFMYGKAQAEPCPMCSMWIDGFNGVARHIEARTNFAILAAAPIDDLLKVAQKRGWENLSFVSAADSSIKRDLGSEDENGGQEPVISVFARDEDGVLRLAYAASAIMGADEYRGIDLLSPVWHIFDLLPAGRGDWYPSL